MIITYVMNLADRDKIFLELKHKIQCKQKSLLERFDNIKEAAGENELLTGVLEDYIKYYKDALEAKKQQEESLTLLRDYLHMMSNAITVSDLQMDYLKQERTQTIERLNDVRRDMSLLLEKTKQS